MRKAAFVLLNSLEYSSVFIKNKQTNLHITFSLEQQSKWVLHMWFLEARSRGTRRKNKTEQKHQQKQSGQQISQQKQLSFICILCVGWTSACEDKRKWSGRRKSNFQYVLSVCVCIHQRDSGLIALSTSLLPPVLQLPCHFTQTYTSWQPNFFSQLQLLDSCVTIRKVKFGSSLAHSCRDNAR